MSWKIKLTSFLLRYLAKAQGFMDPMPLFARLQNFSKPSEVWVPTELLRLGFILQARGIVNSQAIQHNLDWAWPFWVVRQFDPKDKAFMPRAFSLSHINLTHRNWTALGVPDFVDYPLVDDRGLVTPLWDGWSVDCWIISETHGALLPAQIRQVSQCIDYETTPRITTISIFEGMTLETRSWVEIENGIPTCKMQFTGIAPFKACLAVSIRPFNPEGISFINEIAQLSPEDGWNIDGKHHVYLKDKPQRYIFSNYSLGDVVHQIPLFTDHSHKDHKISCPVGMASAAAVYELDAGLSKTVSMHIPLTKAAVPPTASWEEHLKGHCELQIPNKLFQSLYDGALRTLILHSPGDVYPGPYTYKRFWFRDATFILNAMIITGLMKNVEKILDRFPTRQTAQGYFMSQDGEWDSNGQAIWIMQRFAAMTNAPVKPLWLKSIKHAAEWIQKKRVFSKEQSPHQGLLPTGFSAEHLGTNDYYYWDDFWSVAGLNAASAAFEGNDPEAAQKFKSEAADLSTCIEESLKLCQLRLNSLVVPASPYRRIDGGVIGSLMPSYPLQLWEADDQRMIATTDYLLKKCFLDGAFYHEISHSGINVYLSLEVAQVLLRAGDSRFFDIVKTVADLATPTGQWPEAIHPQTKGGCMGDGQHVWAAAEWVMMMRNMFIREEEKKQTVILCSGIPEAWLTTKETMRCGFTQTIFGSIAVTLKHGKNITVSWETKWHVQAPTIEIHLPGYPKITAKSNEYSVEINPL